MSEQNKNINKAKKSAAKAARKSAKKATRKAAKKHPILWVAIILAIVITIFILTPVQNPLQGSAVTDSTSESLAIPATTDSDIIVSHTGYTLSYNEQHEQPNWVAYLLTADEVFGTATTRNDNFREDPLVPTGSATLADYKGSGYDRGHLIPAADSKWSTQAMDDCFYLSNMSPQTHSFNAGIWSNLESAVRTLAAQNREICVVTGPILTDGPYPTIGTNKVSVPKNFYKVILDYYGDEKKAIGFILSQDSKGDLASFAVSVDAVESLSGIDFFPLLADPEENALESTFDVSLWDLSDFNSTATAKKYGYDLSSMTYDAQEVQMPRATSFKDKILFFLYTHFAGYKITILNFFK